MIVAQGRGRRMAVRREPTRPLPDELAGIIKELIGSPTSPTTSATVAPAEEAH